MLLEWTPKMSVGVRVIDEEHQRLFGFLNVLYEAVERKQTHEVLAPVLAEAMAYAAYHFAHEESLFLPTAYPEKDQHVAEHEAFRVRLGEMHAKLRFGASESLSIELMIVLKEWIVAHVLGTDMKITAYVKAAVPVKGSSV